MAKKLKTVSFQTLDEWENDLYKYACSVHNFAGLIKRVLGDTEGFKNWQRDKGSEKEIRTIPVYKSNSQGAFKIKL